MEDLKNGRTDQFTNRKARMPPKSKHNNRILMPGSKEIEKNKTKNRNWAVFGFLRNYFELVEEEEKREE